ncbi:hypothetical protein LXA43DRAFT_1168144 [Ganoderma leucocontextum]|nr:hypothetical protein LXA43DRAFT_1168144 [Ganoderma leucocontextum]
MSASFAWLLFEYCITLDQEIDLFWGQKITGVSVLYLSNRYLPLLGSLWWVPWWRQSLAFNEVLGGLMEYLIYVPVAAARVEQKSNLSAFSALRVYALSGKNSKWAIVTFLLSVSPCLIALSPNRLSVRGSHFSPTLRPPVASNTISCYWVKRSVLAGRLFLVLADVVVLRITWSTMFRSRKYPNYLRNYIQRRHDIFYPDIFDVENLNSIASLLILPWVFCWAIAAVNLRF